METKDLVIDTNAVSPDGYVLDGANYNGNGLVYTCKGESAHQSTLLRSPKYLEVSAPKGARSFVFHLNRVRQVIPFMGTLDVFVEIAEQANGDR